MFTLTLLVVNRKVAGTVLSGAGVDLMVVVVELEAFRGVMSCVEMTLVAGRVLELKVRNHIIQWNL